MIALVCSLVQNHGVSNIPASTGMTIIQARMRPRTGRPAAVAVEPRQGEARRPSGLRHYAHPVGGLDVGGRSARVLGALSDQGDGDGSPHRQIRTSHAFDDVVDIQKHGRSDPGQEGRQSVRRRPEMGARDQADREEGAAIDGLR